ncbi:hypothetical protein [Fibrivirga algicola]|uniref:Uncharacterized protein n=1 Tax=Fibrivirga algicola TaxID=2950420 RepID=A0ABX0QBY9_9BACT|nr:hypothetical protein [Fibrivirga algicola]NID08721.1 hypothetical protein [Fibrivirga algicola]
MAQAYPQTVLQNTLQALSNTDAPPANGIDLIKEWQSTLKNTTGAGEVHQQLTDLYDELLNPTPDSQRVKQLLNSLAAHTQLLARSADKEVSDNLGTLADSLRSLANDLTPIGDDDQLAANQDDDLTIYDLQNPGDRASKMFINTLDTLAEGPAIATPELGSTLIGNWITVVRSDVSTQWIEAPLTQLRDAVTTGDMRNTERLLRDLAGTAQEYANSNPEGPFSKHLTNLATALISFAGPLS